MRYFSSAQRDRRGMYTPCALTRLASVVKQNIDVRLLTAAGGVSWRTNRLVAECRCYGSLRHILVTEAIDDVARGHTGPSIVEIEAARVYCLFSQTIRKGAGRSEVL